MTVGVLLMAYGSPEREDELEAYYTDIRRGRPPTREQLDDLRRRYDAIGGLSPLAERTRAQQDALASRLGDGYTVELGLKHAAPSIEAGAQALVDGGVERVAGVVLAPHYSALSVGQYHERARAVVGADAYAGIDGYGDAPLLVHLLADRVIDTMATIPEPARVEVVFTAHSLPERALKIDYPTYPDQLEETAARVAQRAKLASYRVAFQSAGRTPEPWLGPDLRAVIEELPAAGFDAVVVCPAGFTSDHLEVLYDVDIEARLVAESVGLRLERTPSLNDDSGFVSLLASLVRA